MVTRICVRQCHQLCYSNSERSIEYYKTKKATARTKVTLCYNVVRWDGEEFALDASFKGRKKKNKKGERVFAATKAHKLTKLLIWGRGEDTEVTVIEKIHNSRDSLETKIEIDQLDKSECHKVSSWPRAVGVETAAMKVNLEVLEESIQEVKEKVVNEFGPEEHSEGPRAELCRNLFSSIHFCVNEAKLCSERSNRRAHIEEAFGFTFHPGTQCSCCGAQPIVGWRYHCNECNIDQKCIFSHDINHSLVLIRSPPPQPITAVVAAAEHQRWVVNSIMDRWPAWWLC
jgi:hypothetical protein